MALAELVFEVAGGALRLAGRVLIDVVLDVLVKGVGYAAIKVVRPRSEPDETWCALVGLLVFAAVLALAFAVSR